MGAPLEYASSVAISTHAPAGGATHSAAPSIFAPQYFYSRPCGRGDHFRLQLCDPCGLFLLTPLREGRLVPVAPSCPSATFLLTPLREGRQVLVRVKIHTNHISTHAPAGGATFSVKLPRVILFISTHAPAGGATHAPFPKLLR